MGATSPGFLMSYSGKTVTIGGSLSENTLGLLRVDSKTKATIVAVPWVTLSENSSSSISVADVVMTAGLTNGDKLYAYPAGARSNSAAYQVWTLSNGAWTPVTTYVQTETGSTTQNQAGEAVSTYLPRGSAFWLERQNANMPFYLYGQRNTRETNITIPVGTGFWYVSRGGSPTINWGNN